MITELKEYIKALLDKGYSEDEAWSICEDFVKKNMTEILREKRRILTGLYVFSENEKDKREEGEKENGNH